jgi:16S rRNA (guanine966-N2)-methyltransferase
MENRRSSRSQSGGKGPAAGGRRLPPRGGQPPRDGRGDARAGSSRNDGPGRTGFWKDGNDRVRHEGRGGPRSGTRNDQRGPRGRGGSSDRGRYEPDAAVLPKLTSDLQLTDGRFRAHFLSNSLSPSATPTPRKLREIVFRVISRRVKAGRFLDLGCACGTMGLEAVSRGAMLVTMVERSARIRSFLEKNVLELGIKSGHAEVVDAEIAAFLKQAEKKRRRWDLVFLGTCSEDTEPEILSFLRRGVPITNGGLFLIEHEKDREMPESLGRLRRWRLIKNESASMTIFERP